MDYALLERSARRPDRSFEVDVVENVRTSWPLVESLERFDVYRNPAHSNEAAGQARSGKQPSESHSANEP